MKNHSSSPRSRARVIRALFASLLAAGRLAGAADQTWIDTNANNDWNTAVNLNWDAGAFWTQGNNAIFGGTGETVTLTEGITVGNITFNAGGYTITGDTLTLGAGSLFNTGAFNATVNSILAGVGAGLTKTGAGTLTLGGVNTYTGGTTLGANAGTLLATLSSTQNSIGTGAVSIGTGSTLVLDNINTLNAIDATVNNTFTGSGLLRLNFAASANARNLRLNNVSGFTGTIQLSNSGANGDKWNVVGANAPGATVVVDAGSQLFPNTTASTFAGVRIIGTGNAENRGAIRMTTNLTAPVTLLGDATIGAEGGVLNGTVSTGVAGTSTLTLGTVNSNNLANNMMNGVISNGTGTLALAVFNQNIGNIFINGAGLNTYSGGTTLLNSANGTRLVIGTISGTPYGTGAITIGQAATDKAGIYFTTANQTLANGIVFNTALGTDRPGVRTDTTGITLSGTVNANLAPATFSTNGTGAFRLTGQVTGAQGLTLDNAFGTSITVTLANAAANNNYAGNTTIAGTKGVLVLGAANQIPNGATAGGLVNNGTFNLGGFSDQINGLSGTGTIDGTSGTPTLTLGDNNATGNTFSGVIRNTAGTLNITKIGTGAQTLSGNNTYTGATRVLAGTLNVTGGTLNGTSQVVVGGTGGTGTPVFNLSAGAVTATGSSNSLYIGGTASFPGAAVISGGTFTSSNAAAIITVGDNAVGSYTQTAGTVSTGSTGGFWLANNPGGTGSTVTISGGTLNAGTSASVIGVRGSYVFTMSGTAAVNMGTLQLGHTGGTTNNPTGRTFNLNGGTLRLTNGINHQNGTAVINLNGGTLQANSSTTGFWNNSPSVTATIGAAGITIDTQAFNNTITQVLGGTGALTKTGSGILSLGGSNSYAGATNVNAGGLTVSGTGTLAGTTALSVAAGAQFRHLPATAATVLTLGAGATLNLASGSLVGQTFGSTIAAPGAATVGTGVAVEMSGAYVSGNTYNVLTAASGLDLGTYNLLLLNNTDYTAVLAKTATAVTVTPASQAALSGAYWKGGLAGGAGVWALSDGVASNWTTDGAGTSTALVPGAAANIVFSDAGAVAGDQAGMTLGASMAVNSATFNSANPASLLNTAGLSLTLGGAAGAGITVAAGAGAVTLNPAITLAGAQTWTNDSTNPLTLTGAVNNGAHLLTVGGAGDTSISGVLGGGAGGLTKTGAGTLTLGANPTYSGNTTVNGGTLTLTNATNWTVPGNIIINGGTYNVGGGARQVNMGSPPKTISFGAAGGTLNVNNANFYPSATVGQVLAITTAGGLAPQATIAGSGGINSDNDTLNFNIARGTGGSDLIVTGPIWNGGQVIKSGGGILQLAGANSYTGATTINAGTLLLTGTSPAAGLINVSATGTLGGGGSGGVTTLADDATLAPGTSAGANDNHFALASLSLAESSLLLFELGTPSTTYYTNAGDSPFSDHVAVTGALALNGILRIVSRTDGTSYNMLDAVAGDRWLLFRHGGTMTDNTLDIDEAGSLPLAAGLRYSINTTDNPGYVYLEIAVPEAGTGALLLLGALVLRRRGVARR